jgi:hypothetical protein
MFAFAAFAGYLFGRGSACQRVLLSLLTSENGIDAIVGATKSLQVTFTHEQLTVNPQILTIGSTARFRIIGPDGVEFYEIMTHYLTDELGYCFKGSSRKTGGGKFTFYTQNIIAHVQSCPQFPVNLAELTHL